MWKDTEVIWTSQGVIFKKWIAFIRVYDSGGVRIFYGIEFGDYLDLEGIEARNFLQMLPQGEMIAPCDGIAKLLGSEAKAAG